MNEWETLWIRPQKHLGVKGWFLWVHTTWGNSRKWIIQKRVRVVNGSTHMNTLSSNFQFIVNLSCRLNINILGFISCENQNLKTFNILGKLFYLKIAIHKLEKLFGSRICSLEGARELWCLLKLNNCEAENIANYIITCNDYFKRNSQ